MRLIVRIVLLLAGVGSAALSAEPRSIGDPTNGCIVGAAALPPDGTGFTVMHLERERYYGHPRLVSTLQALADATRQGGGQLRVGDLSMKQGGPMPSGHRSHQTGLDADVWFDLEATAHQTLNPLRSNVSATSLLNRARTALDSRLWTDRHVQTLRTAARQPGVDRIFVNPHIKKTLCRTVSGERAWLHRIRPWHGHDDHFHLRLSCPDDSPECVRQPPVPTGEGCDASLDWWFEPHPAETGKPTAPKPPPPSACRALWVQSAGDGE
jgi:penicillin-insensitive murein endopeptidase